MSKPTFREYVERRSEGDADLRELVQSFDDDLLDAPSWREGWERLRSREPDMTFVMAYRKVWDDYGDVCLTIDRKRAEALQR
jgi:hypothetical protein